MRPLILTDGNGNESEDCKYIYDNGIWMKG